MYNTFSADMHKEKNKKQRAEEKAAKKAAKGEKIPKKLMAEMESII